jgi:hypothetical protein
MTPAVDAVNRKSNSDRVAPPTVALPDGLDPERLVTVQWAADFLSLSDVSIRRYLTIKRLRRFKVGGRTLVKVGDLLKLVHEIK